MVRFVLPVTAVALAMAAALACTPARPRSAVIAMAPELWCPMHPGVRSTTPGQCPICQMTLVPMSTAVGDSYTLDVELAPRAPLPGAATRARLYVRDPRTGTAVTRFDVLHEKLFHLFVVSRDLQHFAHLHPAAGSNGAFDVEVPLPHPGHYQLIADVVPTGGAPQMIQRTITTAGYEGPLHEVPALSADVADKVVGNTRVRLAMRDAVAGGERLLTFTVIDEPTGAPATDLEPYLGAPGHLVSVNADLSAAAHSHPLAEPGPPSSVAFQLLFPRPGMQRVWVQFQRAGRVLTASFTIPVGDRQPTGT